MEILNFLLQSARAPKQLIENPETRLNCTPARKGEWVKAGMGAKEGGRQAREGAVSEAGFIINTRRPGNRRRPCKPGSHMEPGSSFSLRAWQCWGQRSTAQGRLPNAPLQQGHR